MTRTMNKSYSELIRLKTFQERYDYLRLKGNVGFETFGHDRYLNQQFYRSLEWKSLRNYILVRDGGCDLGMEGYEIYGKILIHHINPISPEDFRDNRSLLLDPENLISVSLSTHNALHYGNDGLLAGYGVPIERVPGDTCPWRK